MTAEAQLRVITSQLDGVLDSRLNDQVIRTIVEEASQSVDRFVVHNWNELKNRDRELSEALLQMYTISLKYNYLSPNL